MNSFLLAFFGGVLGTMLAIIFGYVDFSDFSDFGWRSALRPLFIWPWISFPIILTLSNMAWPFVNRAFYPERDLSSGNSFADLFGAISLTTFVGVFVAYPGKEAFRWDVGSPMTVIVCAGVVQFFVMFLADIGIEEVNYSKTFYKAPSRLRKMLGRSDDNAKGPKYRKLPTSRSSVYKYDVGVAGGLGLVKFESYDPCPGGSFRTLEIGGNLRVGKGSSITTRHSLFVGGRLEMTDGSISSDNVITLKKGIYIKGDLKARHLFLFDYLTIDGDLTVSGSVFCEGEFSCSGRVSVGGVIEAWAVCSPDPERVRSENTIVGSTRVEALDRS